MRSEVSTILSKSWSYSHVCERQKYSNEELWEPLSKKFGENVIIEELNQERKHIQAPKKAVNQIFLWDKMTIVDFAVYLDFEDCPQDII